MNEFQLADRLDRQRPPDLAEHAPIPPDPQRAASRRPAAGTDHRRPSDRTDPEHEVLLADSVGIALQVVLDTLSPAERLAFVLHDMFAVPFVEIAAMLERSPERPASSPVAPAGGCAKRRQRQTRT